MLHELDEDLELFDEYLGLTEPSALFFFFFEIFTLNFDVSKNWYIALFCHLAREALSIFSRNNLQKFNISWARSFCSVNTSLALAISSSETKRQYFTVMFLMLKTANSVLLHNRDTSS